MSGRERGQASVELVAVLPLVVGVGLAAGQLLAAGAAREAAAGAAEAGAVALLQGRDARSAAGDALPGWARNRSAVDVAGRRVRVRVRPRAVLPGLAGLTGADESADAGVAR
ncbi:MAG: hypothetical protein ABI950_12390 [Solirubrobacteraceae bacterium]